MKNFDFPTNEDVINNFREIDLKTKNYLFDLWLINISKDIRDILNNDLAILCYWSDWRLERTNKNKSSLDLIVCNSNPNITKLQIDEIISSLVQNTQWIVEKIIYNEYENWEIITFEDEYKVWEWIWVLQVDSEYIDILNYEDDLYKYKNKYFPDRLIDSFFIWWNIEVYKLFKEKLFTDIINKSWFLKKYKWDIKSYYKEEFIFWKDHRWWEDNFDFEWETWIIRYDWVNNYWFKHWPLRALQYKVIELFLSLIITTKDINIMNEFPIDIKSRLLFLKKNNKISNLSESEIKDIVNLYLYFRDQNLLINYIYKNTNVNNKVILRTNTEGEFVIDKNFNKNKINNFYQLFKKL